MTTQAKPRFGLQAHRVFWSEKGEVTCACCPIPFPGSDTSIWDGWQEITPEVMREADGHGNRLACHYCGKEPSRVIR